MTPEDLKRILTPGTRYQIWYKAPTMQHTRTAVMHYIGTHPAHPAHFDFSARPLAGTHSVPAGWMLAVRPADKAPLCLPAVCSDVGVPTAPEYFAVLEFTNRIHGPFTTWAAAEQWATTRFAGAPTVWHVLHMEHPSNG